MARKATWQRHAGPRGAYAAYVYIYILHIIYSKGIQPSVYWKGIQPFKPSPIIYPLIFLNLLLVGLNPLISCKINRWIEARDPSCVDSVDARTTASLITARALKAT